MRNRYGVGAVGRKIHISDLNLECSPEEALELAAWIVASAAPLTKEGLERFLKLVGDAAEGTDLGKAALAALDNDEGSG